MLTVFRRLFQNERVHERYPEDAGVPRATFRGMPLIDAERCCGHAICQDVCPSSAILVTPDAQGGEWALDRARCLACGLCIDACPENALTPGAEFELASRSRAPLVQRTRFEHRIPGGE